MTKPEFRQYLISGEAPKEDWELMFRILGRFGLSYASAEVAEAQPVAEVQAETVVNTYHFFEYADKHGISRSVAGQCWGRLVQEFEEKKHRGLDTPINFRIYPPINPVRNFWGASLRKKVRGLELNSLKKFVEVLDNNKERGISYPSMIGPGKVKFWRGFLEDSISPIDS